MELPNGSKNSGVFVAKDTAVEMKDRILALREKQGLTQHEVAQKAGLQVSTYSRVESGERSERVSAFVVLKIARALGTTVEDLLGPDVPWPEHVKPQRVTSLNEKRVDSLERRMNRLEDGLSGIQGDLSRLLKQIERRK